MTEFEELVTQIHLKAANEIALFNTYKAMYECQAAKHAADSSENYAKASQLMLHRTQLANRPAAVMGATLTRLTTGLFAVTLGDVIAEGDTPEAAYNNFDHLWKHGDE